MRLGSVSSHSSRRALDHDLPPVSLKKVKTLIRKKQVVIKNQERGNKAVFIESYPYDGETYGIEVIMSKQLTKIITVIPWVKTRAE